MDGIQNLLDEIAGEMARRTDRGKAASYIPELANVDVGQFAIAVAGLDGTVHVAGDAARPFSIQSVSKVFTLTLALGKLGDTIWSRVGREPSGNAFNSIVQLEQEKGRPRNPFINAGAITVADLILAGHQPREAIGEIVRFVRFLADDDTIRIDERVAHSELETGDRNASLAHFMRSFGRLDNPVDHVLGVYFHHCALAVTCRQLAVAGLYLAAGGVSPKTGARVISAERARRINAIMLTCGHYDGSGEFAYRVGLPGKSGVGGAILAVAPGRASIAVWSPGLDTVGNSKLGAEALEMLTHRTGWSVFGA